MGINDKDIFGDLSTVVSGTSALPSQFKSINLIIKAGVSPQSFSGRRVPVWLRRSGRSRCRT